MRKRHAFTLIELLVVVSIIALLIAILLPALSAARQTARQMQSSTQVRGIQQGFFIGAQSNKGWYPGIISKPDFEDGSLAKWAEPSTKLRTIVTTGNAVQFRYVYLLEKDYLTPEYLISPAEQQPAVKKWVDGSVLTGTDHIVYSYSLPDLSSSAGSTVDLGRAKEWRDQANTAAVVVSDRLYKFSNAADTTTYESIWSDGRPGWKGSVSFNDNHTEFLADPLIQDVLSYDGRRSIVPDSLFRDADGNHIGTGPGLQYNAKQVYYLEQQTRHPLD